MSQVIISENQASLFDVDTAPVLTTATKSDIKDAKYWARVKKASALKLAKKEAKLAAQKATKVLASRKALFSKVMPKLRILVSNKKAIVEAEVHANIENSTCKPEVVALKEEILKIEKSLPTLSPGLARFAKIELSQLKAELIKLHKGTDTLPSEDTIITHCDEIDMDALDEAEELRAINKLKGTEASDILEKSIKGKTYDSIKEYDLEDDLEDEIIEAKAPELSHEMKDKVVATAMNSDLSGIALFKSIVDEVLPSSILGYLQPFDKVKMTATLAHIRISFNSNKALDHDTFPAFFDVQESIKQRFLVLVNILSDVQAKKIAA